MGLDNDIEYAIKGILIVKRVRSLLFTKICYNSVWQEKNEWRV
jgi:hypothetical protein